MFSALTQATGSTSLQTRKVLIIINLQNDSLLSSGGVQVTANHDFVGKIRAIVPHFRSIGDIIWVRTEITRKPGPVSSNPEQVEAAADQADEKNKKARNAEEQNLADDTSSVESVKDMQFYHPSSRVKARMKKSSPATRLDQRSADLEAFDDDYVPFEDIMTKPRKGIEPTFFVGGTHGAELADEILPVVDPQTDMILTKHYYSAFDQTPLLMTLRMKLVTEVYLCGCLTNVGIYATAADAVQHGMGVTVIEDCLGYRSEDKHVEAMRQMADIMGVNGVDSEEIIETSGGIAPPDAESPIFTGPGVEGIAMTSLSLTGSRTPSVESAHPPHTHNPEGLLTDAQQPTSKVDKRTSSAIGERSEAVTPTPELHIAAKSVSSQSKGGTPGASKRASLMKNRESGLINARTLGPQDVIGAGDSRIIHDILEPGLAKDAFEQLKEEVQWQTMSHRSGQVPRLVAVQGEVGKNGEIPIYRHPADESPPLLPFTACVGKMRKELEQSLQQPFNHVLIQLYRDGNDNISEHSDKTLDIVRDSAIVNMSIGAQRVMTLRTKKSNRTSGVDSPTTSRQTQKIPMPHNSVFVLGSNTNMHWLHGVRADKRPIQQKSEEEMSFGGERISLTFRQIGTFTDSNNKKIWGQGARKKSPSSAGRVRTGDDEEMEAMVRAFGKENHQSDFNWQAEYGQGFDVINLVSAAKPKLSLCRHKIANLRVQLSLLEKNLPYDVVEDKNNKPAGSTNEESSEQRRHRSLPWSHGLSNIEKPTFKDTDEDSTETFGDLAILFYLEKLYPFEPAPAEGADPRDPKAIINKRTYSRAAQSNELLFAWQNLPAITSSSLLQQQQPSSSSQSKGMQAPSSTTVTSDNSNSDNNNADTLFTKDLDVWESYAQENNHTQQEGFIAAPHWTLIDCAFWPVLNEIVHSWPAFRVGRFPALSAYHERVLSRAGVQELVEMGD